MISRTVAGLGLLLVAQTSSLLGQSSQFGVRGIGIPGRNQSVEAMAMGGAIGLLDPASAQAAAPLTERNRLSIEFQGYQEWRATENPGGNGNVQNNRLPLFQVAGPIRRFRVWLAASSSTYTNHDVGVALKDSVFTRGQWVPVTDSFVVRGGVNDLRLAVAYQLSGSWSVGGALHIITGSTRNRILQVFEDTLYRSFRDSSEFSFNGVGLSVSARGRLSRSLTVGLLVRSDSKANVTIDSASAGSLDLPYTFGASLMWRPGRRFTVATQAMYQTWSAMNSDLLARGGVGAKNTLSLALGGQFAWQSNDPAVFPLRFGFRYAQLPFPLIPGAQGTEWLLSFGTGLRLSGDRAQIDLAVERILRRETDAWRETGWALSVGVGVRP